MGSADIISTLPELVLIATALVLLIMESAAEPHRELLATTALGGLAIALVTALSYGTDGLYYSGMLQVDPYARFVSALALVLAALAITVAVPYLRRTLEERAVSLLRGYFENNGGADPPGRETDSTPSDSTAFTLPVYASRRRSL